MEDNLKDSSIIKILSVDELVQNFRKLASENCKGKVEHFYFQHWGESEIAGKFLILFRLLSARAPCEECPETGAMSFCPSMNSVSVKKNKTTGIEERTISSDCKAPYAPLQVYLSYEGTRSGFEKIFRESIEKITAGGYYHINSNVLDEEFHSCNFKNHVRDRSITDIASAFFK